MLVEFLTYHENTVDILKVFKFSTNYFFWKFILIKKLFLVNFCIFKSFFRSFIVF